MYLDLLYSRWHAYDARYSICTELSAVVNAIPSSQAHESMIGSFKLE